MTKISPEISPKTIPKISPETSTNKTILCIDDEYIIRQIVQICIEDFSDWKIKFATSGEEGLNSILTSKPDAILLDLMMPHMDGFTFFKELQADVELAQIPVVLLTACTDMTQCQNFANLGFKGVIIKPFEPIALIPQIANILGW